MAPAAAGGDRHALPGRRRVPLRSEVAVRLQGGTASPRELRYAVVAAGFAALALVAAAGCWLAMRCCCGSRRRAAEAKGYGGLRGDEDEEDFTI